MEKFALFFLAENNCFFYAQNINHC